MSGVLFSPGMRLHATILTPDKIDKRGPMYSEEKVHMVCLKSILAGSYFYSRGKTMSDDITKARESVESAIKLFNTTLNRMVEVEKKTAEQTKKTSASVRQSTTKLAEGLARIEKAANFDRLERYTELLERSAAALSTLAELEDRGALERIASAMSRGNHTT